MKIIDAHLHISFKAPELIDAAKQLNIDYSEKGLLKEMKKNDIEYVVGISSPGKKSPLVKETTPAESKETIPTYKKYKNLLGVCTVTPLTGKKTLKLVEEKIKEGVFRAFKIFPGYFYFYPYDRLYFPFYKLAEKYDIPVIIHSGLTLKKNALLKYTHPMNIDEAAVLFPNVKFIMAHLGNPWIQTTKAILYKNDNVYADLSGLFEGSDYGELEEIKDMVEKTIEWIGSDKLLYGSDWPLVKMEQYIHTFRAIIPKTNHKKIFYENAKKIFHIN